MIGRISTTNDVKMVSRTNVRASKLVHTHLHPFYKHVSCCWLTMLIGTLVLMKTRFLFFANTEIGFVGFSFFSLCVCCLLAGNGHLSLVVGVENDLAHSMISHRDGPALSKIMIYLVLWIGL